MERKKQKEQLQPKELARRYMETRKASRKPPPDQNQIRRELGWDLIETQRKRKVR